MSDDIGYQITSQDVAAVVSWLQINDPDNANPEFARNMLKEMRAMFREMGQINEDLLYKAHEEYKKKTA